MIRIPPIFQNAYKIHEYLGIKDCGMKVLLIEDEESLVETISAFLREEGYVCETATTYARGLEKVGAYEYDCLLVDIGLPDGSGLEVIKRYRKNGSAGGIIVISAKDSLDDKIAGLNLGADDYLTKPFHLQELNARIKSLNRRIRFDGDRKITFKDITVDTDCNEVVVNGHELSLTRKEFEMLLFFLQNNKRVLSKGTLAEHLWGDYMDMADSYDFIYSQIKNLRKKINRYSEYEYLHSVYGVGYKLYKE